MYDPVDNPRHYCEDRTIQPIDVIEDWNLPPHLANVLKYIARYEKKNGLEDLKRAQWWLNRFVSQKEKTVSNKPPYF